MKRFTLLFSFFSLLAFWAVFQAWSEARADVKKASIAPLYDSTGAMLETINPRAAEKSIVPVYDATVAMLNASNLKEAKVRIIPVYDATGAMLDAINP